MEPTPQEPQQDLPTPETFTPFVVQKKSKKPLVIAIVVIILLVAAGVGGWFWWSSQQPAQTANTTPQPVTNTQKKAIEPNTVAYSYIAPNTSTSDLLWRAVSGGEQQTSGSKAFVGSARTYGNQVVVETYYNTTSKEAPSIMYSSDGGKSYKTIFTGKVPSDNTMMGDQVTGMIFASDGKSVVFGLLSDPGGKNIVKQIFFNKPSEVTDITTISSSGVFPISFNSSTKQLVFSKGCYNCDGNSSTSVLLYDAATKQTSTLVDGSEKYLTAIANKSATKLLLVQPTVDKNKTDENEPWGYYVGAPYTLSVLDVASGKTEASVVSTDTPAENQNVSGGFMLDDTTPYYFVGNKLYSIDKDSSSLLYETSKPIVEAFYVSPTTVFASNGVWQNYTLNRFDIKTQKTTPLLTGDSAKTRVFGITQN